MTERTYEQIAADCEAVGHLTTAETLRALIAERDAARAEGVRAGLEAAAECRPPLYAVYGADRTDNYAKGYCGGIEDYRRKCAFTAADPEAIAAIVAGMKGDQDDR